MSHRTDLDHQAPGRLRARKQIHHPTREAPMLIHAAEVLLFFSYKTMFIFKRGVLCSEQGIPAKAIKRVLQTNSLRLQNAW